MHCFCKAGAGSLNCPLEHGSAPLLARDDVVNACIADTVVIMLPLPSKRRPSESTARTRKHRVSQGVLVHFFLYYEYLRV